LIQKPIRALSVSAGQRDAQTLIHNTICVNIFVASRISAPQPVAYRLVDLICRTALAAVAFPKPGANAHRLIVAIAFSINQQAVTLAARMGSVSLRASNRFKFDSTLKIGTILRFYFTSQVVSSDETIMSHGRR
jgi:hypothetical protein